jgi:hypothetical protein
MSVQILFACTTLSSSSTFVQNFSSITSTLSKYLNTNSVYATFVLNQSPDSSHHERSDLVHNYHIVYQDLIPFLSSHPSTFDTIVLNQCDNLVLLFPYFTSLNQLTSSVQSLYDALKTNGLIINFWYQLEPTNFMTTITKYFQSTTLNQAILSDWAQFHAFSNIYEFPQFLLLVFIMNSLFEKLETGVYRKRNNLSVGEVVDESYTNALRIIYQIYNLSLENQKFSGDKYLQLIHPYLDNQYIGMKLNPSALEKSVMQFFNLVV